MNHIIKRLCPFYSKIFISASCPLPCGFSPLPLLLFIFFAYFSSPLLASETHSTSPEVSSLSARNNARRTPVVAVFENTRNSVVNIAATSIIEIRSPWDDMFQFFDLPDQQGPTRRYQTASAGSGFVIHPAGYVVTNAHVVSKTTQRQVIFADKRQYPAQIIALDQEHDLAILKISADQPLQPLSLGQSDDLMVGETVVAIGNPLGYQHTCTAGVVSALNRNLDIDRNTTFRGLIQTDASINPGNSGGPLLNVLGELIGINTAIRGDAQNIGFAIPVDQLREVLPEMLDVERRYRIRTGLEVEEIPLNGSRWCRIKNIAPDSPASACGLRTGDILTSLDSQPIHSAIDFWINLIGAKPSQTIRLQFIRNNQPFTSNLQLQSRPSPDGSKLLAHHFGIFAEEISQRMAKSMGMNGLQALLVQQVQPNSPAQQIGLQRGDVIIQLGRHPAQNLQDIGELLEKLQPNQPIPITVLRIQGNVILRSTTTIQSR